MEARVKQDYNAGPIMAFSGREFVKSEWREVPAGSEDAARNHPLLDVREPSNIEVSTADQYTEEIETAANDLLEAVRPQVELVTEKELTLEAPTLEEILHPRRNRKSRKDTEASE